MKPKWMDKVETFEVMDVRKLRGNFLPAILKKAQGLEVSKGLYIIQSFEPIPLYSALGDLGYEYYTEKASKLQYRVYFYRVSKAEPTYPGGMDIPLKPTAIVNIKGIDPNLADIIVNFWNLIWAKEDSVLDMKTKFLLGLANAVGGGRIRQATRELIKAYSVGATTAELDEVFALFVWDQGIGHFASEIGPSALFASYQYIKTEEEKGIKRSDIIKGLTEKFGERNPDVSTEHIRRNKKD